MIESKRTNVPWWRAATLVALGAAGMVSAQENAAEEEAAPASRPWSIPAPEGKPLEKEFVLRERLDAFFTAIQAGKVDEAYGNLLKGSKIGEKQENVDELVRNTNEVLERFGEMLDSELVRAERVGGRVIRLSYLSYGADFPLQWQFYCYRGTEDWQILDINVNNDLEQIFRIDASQKGPNGAPDR